jgi:hypothetical protein
MGSIVRLRRIAVASLLAPINRPGSAATGIKDAQSLGGEASKLLHCNKNGCALTEYSNFPQYNCAIEVG